MHSDIASSPSHYSTDMPSSWQGYASRSPVSAQFPPYAISSQQAGTWSPTSSDAASHDHVGWGQYGSSVHASGYEDDPSQHPGHYLSMSQGFYPTSLGTSMSDVDGAASPIHPAASIEGQVVWSQATHGPTSYPAAGMPYGAMYLEERGGSHHL